MPLSSVSPRVLGLLFIISWSNSLRKGHAAENQGQNEGRHSIPAAAINKHAPSPFTADNPSHSCGFNFTTRVLWSTSIGGPGSPFVAAPVLAPLLPTTPLASSSSSSGGNYVVVSAAFHGEIGVLQAANGLPLPGSRYPLHLPSATVFGSPLLHDVDADGALDVVVVTGEGVVHAFDLVDGARVADSFLIDPLRRIERKWLEATMEDAKKAFFPGLSVQSLREERMEEEEVEEEEEKALPGVTTMEPRVMASAVIVDLNLDGRAEEMIVPITYSDEGKRQEVLGT